MKTPAAVCENDSCEKVIHGGKRVKYKGTELYCPGNA